MNTPENERIEQGYRDFIVAQNHPCIMANTVFQLNNYHLKIYDSLDSDENIQSILSDIESFIKNYDFSTSQFESLIFCFKEDNFKNELDFENALWNFLQKLHDADDAVWDPEVSNDPENPNFSFSLKSKAFYVIGMHPESSRFARKAPYCTLVFNMHWQFEKLRSMGTYQTTKKRIRNRDLELQGSINPVLVDFGDASETKQYSGRHVEENWKCPFHHK